MKTGKSVLVATLLASVLLACCVERRVVEPRPPAQTVYIAKPPPAEVADPMPPPPDSLPVWAWQKGHWRWDGRAYVWYPGHWVERPQHVVEWVAPHWERHADGWVMIEGHWR